MIEDAWAVSKKVAASTADESYVVVGCLRVFVRSDAKVRRREEKLSTWHRTHGYRLSGLKWSHIMVPWIPKVMTAKKSAFDKSLRGYCRLSSVFAFGCQKLHVVVRQCLILGPSGLQTIPSNKMEALGINVCLNQRLTQRQLSSCLATLEKEHLK